MPHFCPNCRNRNFSTLVTEEAIRRETFLRARFVAERVEKMPPREERKDLTDFAHGQPASILQCTPCTLLVRAEEQNGATERYANDPYDAGVMEQLFPRYVEAFRRKEAPYRSLLREGAEVLEIGSHFGAFLKVAAEWGWKPVGIDVGRDTASFARSKGLLTYRGSLQDFGFPGAHFDAVFVWNCFEQIEEPHLILTEIRRVLKPGGLLLLRTPNALFYRIAKRFLAASPAGDVATWVVRALGYNNLLAFPYLYGYQSQTLTGLAEMHGFRCAGKLNAEVITLTFPVLSDWVLEEVQATRAALLEWSALDFSKTSGQLTGPWIEVFYRAV